MTIEKLSPDARKLVRVLILNTPHFQMAQKEQGLSDDDIVKTGEELLEAGFVRFGYDETNDKYTLLLAGRDYEFGASVN